jgi:hypothetical protein
VVMALYPESAIEGSEMLKEEELGMEEDESFVVRPHRRSLLGAQAPTMESQPLRGMEEEDEFQTQGNLMKSPQLQFE